MVILGTATNWSSAHLFARLNFSLKCICYAWNFSKYQRFFSNFAPQMKIFSNFLSLPANKQSINWWYWSMNLWIRNLRLIYLYTLFNISRRKLFSVHTRIKPLLDWHRDSKKKIGRKKWNIVFGEVSLYQKSSLSRLSIEHAAAIRMPSSLSTAARSIPLSSANSICKKSPTLWVTGRSANWHFSFRLGNGTTTCGNPRIYFTVTIGERRREKRCR